MNCKVREVVCANSQHSHRSHHNSIENSAECREILLTLSLYRTKNMAKAKPFIKWVGGKSQLIDQLESHLPADFDVWNNITYIEPFVGGIYIISNV
jgi:hypothetical protein